MQDARLRQLLLHRGLVRADVLDQAARARPGLPLGEALLTLGILPADTLRRLNRELEPGDGTAGEVTLLDQDLPVLRPPAAPPPFDPLATRAPPPGAPSDPEATSMDVGEGSAAATLLAAPFQPPTVLKGDSITRWGEGEPPPGAFTGQGPPSGDQTRWDSTSQMRAQPAAGGTFAGELPLADAPPPAVQQGTFWDGPPPGGGASAPPASPGRAPAGAFWDARPGEGGAAAASGADAAGTFWDERPQEGSRSGGGSRAGSRPAATPGDGDDDRTVMADPFVAPRPDSRAGTRNDPTPSADSRAAADTLAAPTHDPRAGAPTLPGPAAPGAPSFRPSAVPTQWGDGPPAPGASSAGPDAAQVRLPRKPGERGRLGAYELVAELGRGGMGAVYRAVESATGREVALKVILGDQGSRTLRERFAREGQLTARLQHPGIVGVLGAGELGGVQYIVYELVDGARSLSDLMGELDRQTLLHYLRDAARALGHAHRQGILHRDVKPDNMLIDREGRLRVTDFGLAHAEGAERLTRTGAQLGTPAYMAPEQADANRAAHGPHTDVWGLGVILFEILTGERPFQGHNFNDLVMKITGSDPPLPRTIVPGVPADLEAVCLKALAREPHQRYRDGEAMALDLERALAHRKVQAAPVRPWLRRLRRWRWGLLVGAILLAGGLGTAVLRPTLFPQADLSDTIAPAIEVVSGLPDGTRQAEQRLTVLVTDDAEWVDVSVAGGQPARVRPGERFLLRVTLQPGENHLVVRAVDPAGNQSQIGPLDVLLADEPEWFLRLKPAERPPYPLPEGLIVSHLDRQYEWGPDGSVLVWVPPGTFTLGGRTEEMSFARAITVVELPEPRRVTLTRGFFIGKYEVSYGQYARFCHATGHRIPDRHNNMKIVPGEIWTENDWRRGEGVDFDATDQHPVWRIDWFDAQAYCEWAGLRLPHEVEWEYAARGPDGRSYPWGNEKPNGRLVNQMGDKDDEFPYTSPVTGYTSGASPFGCLNMAGNVEELTADWHGPYPAPRADGEPLVDPQPPATGTEKVTRGANWTVESPMAFLTYLRTWQEPDNNRSQQGLRVALSPLERAR